jgi:NitT/TauT family transport system ATP-binding protein
MPEPLLNIQSLCFSFGTQKIIEDLFLTVEPNEIVTLLGWSGCGKTTLLKLLTGILKPQYGSINFLEPAESLISYMAQEDLLLPWRTVKDNLHLLSELGKGKQTPILDLVKILHEVGLEKCGDLYPEQLSGGMRQRVSLARALMQNRPLLLLDEPFGSLDVVLREQLYELLQKIKEKRACSILMVTHDFHDAVRFSDRIFLMHAGKIHKTWNNQEDQAALTHEIRHELFDLG